MAGAYRRNVARNRYFQEMEYGEWYDAQMARDRHYKKWAQELNARDEWARRNPPAPGSYEEYMTGLKSWTYGVEPYHAWRYGPRPATEAIHHRDWDWGNCHPEKEDGLCGWHWPRKHCLKDRYEYIEPGRYRPERYEYVYSRRRQKRPSYVDSVDGSDYVLPAKYVLGGRKKGKKIPRFHGKEFQVKRMWKDWPKIYIGDHPERDGIKVKTQWKKWPIMLVS